MRINSNYSIRPTQADLALTPIGEIQRILGHENRSTIEIYLHPIGETERDAIMRIFDREIKRKFTHRKKKDIGRIS